MDIISIDNLEIYAHHGVFTEENVLGQKFLVSVKLFMDCSKAARLDDIDYSVDYSKICYFIKKLMEEKNYKLIEAVAYNIASGILLQCPLVRKVHVDVKKPWAPIMLPVDTVSVSTDVMWHKAYLSIGSNIGDREGFLDFAIDELNKDKVTKVIKISEYIETKPYGYIDQNDFMNSALEIETMLSPRELLELAHSIEAAANRKRDIHWGPRTLDIDILFYDDCIIDEEDLTIPHIEISKRDFVLRPLCSIAPYIIHPIYKEPVIVLFERLNKDKGEL